MLPPSLAIGWTFWRRHSWGLLVVLSYVLVAGVISALLPGHFAPETGGAIAVILIMPLTWAVLYLMGVFSYGFEADVNTRHSCFPPGLFTLPVGTRSLAGWPLFYGAATVSLLWLATARLILQPWLGFLNLQMSLWWPACLAVAALAWIQALLWSSFGIPLLRIFLTIGVISGVVAVAQICAASNASEGFLVVLFTVVAAVAWAVAYAGVRRARYGDVPNWEGLFSPVHRLARRPQRRRQPFTSAADGQAWFEWKRTGKTLPFMTACVLPFVLMPLLFGKNDVLPTARTLLTALAMPLFLAGIAGTTVSGKNRWVKDYYGVAPFNATLPITTAGMVAAKLKAAAWSTLVAWGLLVVMVLVALTLTGNLAEVAGWWEQALDDHHPAKVIAGITAAAIFLVVWTWKRDVDSLLLGLTGRKWVIQGALFGGMAGLLALLLIGGWIYKHPETHATVAEAAPWLLGLLVLCRLLAAGWALKRCISMDLFEARIALRWVAAWLLLASLLIGLLAWSLPPGLVPFHYLVLAVVSVFPAAHLACTPLALAWNRHR